MSRGNPPSKPAPTPPGAPRPRSGAIHPAPPAPGGPRNVPGQPNFQAPGAPRKAGAVPAAPPAPGARPRSGSLNSLLRGLGANSKGQFPPAPPPQPPKAASAPGSPAASPPGSPKAAWAAAKPGAKPPAAPGSPKGVSFAPGTKGSPALGAARSTSMNNLISDLTKMPKGKK